jgi:hypothetical protein
MEIREIAENKIVEKLINKISPTAIAKEDLVQDIYLSLLTNSEKVESISNDEIKYYITKIILNNIKSVNSPYYKLYVKYYLLKQELLKEIEDEED